ncbi:MAG: hypothetical protein M3N13_09275 [Candidatus Eremiobacteraeota bacterium]|nr:hypothetical protein [Candidatus Eremiobacteraeota bacterium]
MDATPAFPLRALGIGEIFDRAVTIYVRNFVVFTLMVLTLLAPYSVVEYFAIPDSGASFAKTIDTIQHPEKHAKDSTMPPATLSVIIAAVLVLVLFSPFVASAVAFGVAAVYQGKRPDYLASFSAVFRRWLTILGTALVEMLVLFGTYTAMAVVVAIAVVVAALAVRPALPVAIALFALAAVLLLGTILILLVLLLNYIFATYAATLENVNVGGAIASGFRRIFNKKEFGKALLMGLAYLALQLGVLTLSGTIGVVLLYVVKNYALQLAVSAVISSALTAFLSIVVAVYYYDVRTRAEGLDLEDDLRRLTS